MDFNRNNDFVGRAETQKNSKPAMGPRSGGAPRSGAARLFSTASVVALTAAVFPISATAAPSGACSDSNPLPGIQSVICTGASTVNDTFVFYQTGGSVGVVSDADWTQSGGVPALFVALDGAPFSSAFGTPGNQAGAVSLDHDGTIVSTGNFAGGIYLISGGGNGIAGEDQELLSAGGSGGSGGSIYAEIRGSISTSGDDAIAISAISQGGNGGKGGDATIPSSGGFSGSGGQGGWGDQVEVVSYADITTLGASSHGIVAQSLGGDGANAGIAGAVQGTDGSAGGGSTVSVESSGNISATGSGSIGILAESRGGDWRWGQGSSGAVNVDIIAGSVTGGSGSGWGVNIQTAANSVLQNAGSISALSGNAVNMSGDFVELQNNGTISGNVVALSRSYTTFNNHAGALFEPGDTVNLGTPSSLGNSGTLSPGSVGTVQTTTLTGSFLQNSNGVFLVDADWAHNTADRIDVSNFAEIAGTVVVNPISFPDSNDQRNAGLRKQWTILTATIGVLNNGMTVTDTAAVDYELLYPDANTVDLQATINFLGTGGGAGGGGGGLGTGGLNGNQTSVGKTLNKVVGGGGSFGFVPDILGLGTHAQLQDALNQLTPAGDGAGFSSAMGTGQTFAGQLLSCRVAGEGDAHAVIREGQCVWARGTGRRLDNDGGESGVGFKEDAAFFSGGMQFDIGGNWRVGGGLGYESIGLSTDSRASSEGERAHVGGVIKYNPGPWLFAASVTGGYGWFDNKRVVSFGNFASVATSDYNDKFVTGQLTAAHQLNLGRDLYLKPQIMAGLTHLNRDGYTETASRDAGLDVHGSSDTVFSLSPSLELGGQVAMAHGIARPYLRAGLTWRSEDTFSTTANFSAAPGGANSFTVTSSVDDVVADIGAGIDFIAPGDTALRFEYGGQFGEQTTQHSGSAKISVPF